MRDPRTVCVTKASEVDITVAHKRATMILAAGQGTRMKSPLPKVLHPIAGVPMVVYAIEAALATGTDDLVLVVGHGRDTVIDAMRARFGERLRYAVQEHQRGTADAVRAGMSVVSPDVTEVLITYGDVPCVPSAALTRLVDTLASSRTAVALLTCTVDDPTGYGRILRDGHHRVISIREQKDCTPAEREIREINPGFYAAEASFLTEALGAIRADNAQGEFYLTDLVAMAAERGGVATVAWEPISLRGVNDRAELADAESLIRRRIVDAHRRAGSTIAAGAVIDHDVVLSPGVTVATGAVLRGNTRVETGSTIDVGCVLDDAVVGERSVLKPYSVISHSELRSNTQIGPFAHLRPDSVVEDGAHVGNFVELKKTRLGPGAKANHLAYLGDGVIGAGANIGAGTIFCNYDGKRKHVTTIGEGAFVGSNSSLVAPVTLGKGAYVGSGSVVTMDVPDDALAIGRARQVNKPGLAARLRNR